MGIFRIYETLAKQNNVHIVKDYKTEGVKKIHEGTNKSILGEIEGVFFVPDGVSANDRFYSKHFWETVLASADVRNKLERKIMYGRVGHEDRDVEENDINDGKVSHIVTKLWIDENNQGMGHAIILDTPAGRNLYACLSAGSDLRISSRASGDYKPNEYYDGNIPVMDENVYVLDTFDMVIFPGFIETSPKLVAENYPNKKQTKTEQTVKKQECTNSEKRRHTMPGSNNERTAIVAKAKTAIAKAEAKAAKAESALTKSEVRYESLLKRAKAMASELKKYRAEGKIADIQKAKSELNSFKRIAETPKALQEGLDKLKASIESAQTFKAEAEEGRQYKATLEKAKPVLESYVKLGSLAEVSSKMNKLEAEKKAAASKNIAEKVQSYSRKTGMTREAIRGIFESAKDYDSAIKVLESLPAKKDESLYKGNKNESAPKKKVVSAAKTESKQSSQGSIAARIMESRSRDLVALHNDVDGNIEDLT